MSKPSWALPSAVVAVVLLAAASRVEAAVTYGYTLPSCTQVQLYANDVSWADLHYRVNGGTQLNVRMTQSGTSAVYVASGLSVGAVVDYSFTYAPSGSSAAADTSWSSLTLSCPGGGGGGSTGGGGGGGADACSACRYHDLVWADDFDGAGQPSSANWNYHVGNGYNAGLPGFQGWGNGEWEWYRPEQSYLQEGKLVIRADAFSSPTPIAGSSWYQRSGRLTTQGKHAWSYARVEARIALPTQTATWPAFWMMGESNDGTYTSNYTASIGTYDQMATNWPSCGEIDILEHVNADAKTYQNLFWDTRTGILPWASGITADDPSTSPVGDVTQFHVYAMEWDATNVSWYIDNVRVKTRSVAAANQEEFHQRFFIILNLALAGTLPGTTPTQTDFPAFMTVDYVRVYQGNTIGGGGGGGTPDTRPPAAPTNLGWASDRGTVTLTWSPSTDDVGVVAYDLFFGSFYLGAFDGPSVALIGFKAGTPYTFTVRARDATGNVSAASSPATVLLGLAQDTTPPTAPANLSAANVTATSVTLRWSASSDDVGVVLYQVLASAALKATVAGSTSAVITGLSASTSYSLTIKALDAAGNASAPSSPLVVTTLGR
jgi:beta-glucanase (GH16 family)